MVGDRQRRRARRSAPWRRGRRIALVAAAICLLPAALSWLRAVSRPHNVGLGVTTVEWARSHGGNGIVSQVENWYYTLTAPSKGGPPLKSLPRVGVDVAAQSSRPAGGVERYRPPRVQPLVHPALKGEGEWRPAAAHAGPEPAGADRIASARRRDFQWRFPA